MPIFYVDEEILNKRLEVEVPSSIYEELRREKSNVYVGVLCPGPVDTEFNKVANNVSITKGSVGSTGDILSLTSVDVLHIGTKEANAFGLYDMSGNVGEWCWNWFTVSYDTTTEGGSDPIGASWGDFRVFRGGSWDFNSDYCAVSFRNNTSPGNRYYDLGFRVVRLAN